MSANETKARRLANLLTESQSTHERPISSSDLIAAAAAELYRLDCVEQAFARFYLEFNQIAAENNALRETIESVRTALESERDPSRLLDIDEFSAIRVVKRKPS